MKRVITYLFLLFLVASCSKEPVMHYTIKGNVNVPEAEIIAFGIDSRLPRVDSIKTDEFGNFSYTIESDTLVPFIMVMPDGKQISLFAEKGITAELAYDTAKRAHTITNAGRIQMLHDSISQEIDTRRDNKRKIEALEKFIEKHPVNEVNIELLRRYMINVPTPDYTKIKNLISRLGGILQDNEYLSITKENIEKRSGNTLHRQFPAFTYTTADSCKEITLSTFNNKHTLVTFWASWDNESCRQVKLLQTLRDSIKSENFEILNIALEHDTAAWKRCIENDSITGYNVCEKEAWSSEIANKFNISSIPYSVLLNSYQRVIRVGIDIEKDAMAIDSIIAKHEKSIKEREKREKEKEKEKKSKEKKEKNKKRK